jgi:hypothetical protein
VRQKYVRVDLQVVECNDNFFEDKQGKEKKKKKGEKGGTTYKKKKKEKKEAPLLFTWRFGFLINLIAAPYQS